MSDRELLLLIAWVLTAISVAVRPDEAAMRRAIPQGHMAIIEDVRLAGPLTWTQPSGWRVVPR